MINKKNLFFLLVAVVCLCLFFWKYYPVSNEAGKNNKDSKPFSEHSSSSEIQKNLPHAGNNSDPILNKTPDNNVQADTTEQLHPVLFGKVMGVNSLPAAFADVQLVKNRKLCPKMVTNENGEYRSQKLEPGEYIVCISYAGYIAYEKNVNVIDENTDMELDVQLDRGGFISGRVTDENHIPISGIRIEANCNWGMPGALTNTEGEYEIWGLKDSYSYTIRTAAEDYLYQGVNNVKVNSSGIDLMLKKGGSIEGRIVEKSTGRPVNKDLIAIKAERDYNKKLFNFGNVTDNGFFAIKGLDSGAYYVVIVKNRMLQSSIPLKYKQTENIKVDVKAGQSVSNIVIEIEECRKLNGRILDKNTHSPVSNAGISVIDAGNDDLSGYERLKSETKSAADGGFVLEGLNEGNYNLIVHAFNYASHAESVFVAGNADIDEIEIMLSRGGVVKGVVRNSAGNVLSDMLVLIAPVYIKTQEQFDAEMGLNESIHLGKDSTDDTGEYEIKDVPKGKYGIFIADERNGVLGSFYLRAPYKEIDILENETTVCDISYGQYGAQKSNVSGSILKEGQPAGISQAVFASFDGVDVIMAGVEDDGKYSVELSPGKYTVFFTELSFNFSVTVPEQPEFNLDINIPAFYVKGKVLDNLTSLPVQDAIVMVLRNSKMVSPGAQGLSEILCGYSQTNEKGEFVVENLADGGYFVEVAGKDYANFIGNISVSQNSNEDFIVYLSKGGIVSGKAVDMAGNPVAGVYFGLEDCLTGLPILMPSFFSGNENDGEVISAEDGTFKYPNLKEGKYLLTAVAEDFAPVSKEIFVTAGLTTTAFFALPKGGGLTVKTTDSDGNPVSGVTVVLLRKDGGMYDNVFTPLTIKNASPTATDVNGDYKRENISAGEYVCLLRKSGYADSKLAFEVEDGISTVLKLQITR
ncbi:MAG: carboxypeptidase regulatory-like domain-containing protein [Planctomycetes bacterium]|nr:carboxypeptidase regulatory-like domain-containing protein [Planctomycetota bacterium]